MEQKLGNIAYCIPTYNHPDTIRDVLEKSAALYKEYGIDIYIYDSSEERDTEDIVNEFIQCGYDNIFYIKMECSIREKIKSIFMQYGWKKQYKYFWLVKDRRCFGEKTINRIVHNIDDNSDVIFLTIISKYPMEDKEQEIQEYNTDVIEFYRNWGWLSTSMDVTILNTRTMLFNIEEIYEKYADNVMEAFPQCIILWENLDARKDNAKIRMISRDHLQVYESSYSTSGWRKRRFEILKTWVNANDSLPEYYQRYKEETTKKFAALPWLLGSVDELIGLQKDSLLDEKVYVRMKTVWNRLVDIPLDWVYLIINERYFELRQIVLKQIEILIEKEKYEQAYWIYKTNTWIGRYDNDIEYKVLNKFFIIYQREKDRENRNDVFYAVKSYEDMKNKYFSLKHLLWRLEYGIGDNEEFHLLKYMREYKVSNIFLAYLISESCVNKDKVVNSLINRNNKE